MGAASAGRPSNTSAGELLIQPGTTDIVSLGSVHLGVFQTVDGGRGFTQAGFKVARQPLREQGLLRGGPRRARLRRSAGRPGGARGVREKGAGGRASPSCEWGQGHLRAAMDARGARHFASTHDSGLAVAAATKPQT
jgi:hypothetical protein